MSASLYYLLWLTGGLVIVAIVSGVVAYHFRQRVTRRLKAAEMLDALNRYSEWVAAQRATLLFQGQVQDSAALREVRGIGQQWFAELAAPVAQIAATHVQLLEFLSAQQALRLLDPEAWLEADHDAQFLQLWRQHLFAVHGVIERLRPAGETGDGAALPGGAPA